MTTHFTLEINDYTFYLGSSPVLQKPTFFLWDLLQVMITHFILEINDYIFYLGSSPELQKLTGDQKIKQIIYLANYQMSENWPFLSVRSASVTHVINQFLMFAGRALALKKTILKCKKQEIRGMHCIHLIHFLLFSFLFVTDLGREHIRMTEWRFINVWLQLQLRFYRIYKFI